MEKAPPAGMGALPAGRGKKRRLRGGGNGTARRENGKGHGFRAAAAPPCTGRSHPFPIPPSPPLGWRFWRVPGQAFGRDFWLYLLVLLCITKRTLPRKGLMPIRFPVLLIAPAALAVVALRALRFRPRPLFASGPAGAAAERLADEAPSPSVWFNALLAPSLLPSTFCASRRRNSP